MSEIDVKGPKTLSAMKIPTEPIGSIPRPPELIAAIAEAGDFADPKLDPLYEDAIQDTIAEFEATGSPVITDGEQRKYHNFWTYSVHGLPNTAPDGFKIPFSAGHVRRMPRLTAGPFRYRVYADRYLDLATRFAHMPLKQAVISPSALSLMYPAEDIPGYSRQQFIDDLLHEHEIEIRRCFEKGAQKVQIDFTEGALRNQGRSHGQSSKQLHWVEQPGTVAIFERGAATHRGAHLPRRRPRFHPQRRRRLRGSLAQLVRTAR